jgi:hypothetical protein
MNYKKNYYDYINYIKSLSNRPKTKKDWLQFKKNGDTRYFEFHHIIPKCFGGNESIENFIALTAREHFLAHYLLFKFTEGQSKYKMKSAFLKMCSISSNQKRYINSKLYESIKTNKVKMPESVKNKIKDSLALFKQSPRYKNWLRLQKLNPGRRGKTMPESWINPLKGIPRTDEVKLKISLNQKGIPKKRESVEKQKLSMTNRLYITNGKSNKMIHKEELENYLKDGWRQGRINYRRFTKKYKRETIEKRKETIKNYKWYTNGEKNTLSNNCPEGFRPGKTGITSIAFKLSSKDKHWFNNGEKSILAYECPEGFKKGRLSYNKK